MTLDMISTLFLMTYISIMVGVLMAFVAVIHRNEPFLLGVSLGFAINGLGLFLYTLEGIVPTFIPIVIGNSLLLFWYVCASYGIRKMAGVPFPVLLYAIPITLNAVAMYWLTFIDRDIAVRVSIFNGTSTLLAILFLRDLILMGPVPNTALLKRADTALFIVVFSVYILCTGLRSFIAATNAGQYNTLAAQSDQVWLIFITSGLYPVVAIGLMWIWIRVIQEQLRDRANELVAAHQQSERLRKEAEVAALSDVLTGLGNRRLFDSDLERELDRFRRFEAPLSLLVLDIDHFKAVNDSYGHDAGDQVLADFATLLRPHVRETDGFYRTGGEEFVVLLPETDVTEAAQIAERLRQSVDADLFVQDRSVTVSIGLAVSAKDDTAKGLYKRADQMLYTAKNQGRNCVIADQTLAA